MTEPGDTRVAVYIDFDNIVISRYDQVHGRGQFQRDKVRGFSRDGRLADPDTADKIRRATVDVGAVIDFASSFGTLVLTRAYADWSAPVNADYRGQLVSRAVDLVQLFPAAAYAKNGADIRLAVDAVEDMFRLPDLTHVVIVAGIPITSPWLSGAGGWAVTSWGSGSPDRPAGRWRRRATNWSPTMRFPASPASVAAAGASPPPAPAEGEPAEPQEPGDARSARGTRRTRQPAAAVSDEPDPEPENPQEQATRLLERALRLGQEKDDADWLHSSAVKSQMRRMDPSFSERALGYRSFSDFVKSREAVAELDETDPGRLIRLNPAMTAQSPAPAAACPSSCAGRTARRGRSVPPGVVRGQAAPLEPGR